MTQIARRGAISKGVKAGSSLSIAPDSAATRARLRALQSRRPGSLERSALPSVEHPEPIRIETEAVRDAIMSFFRASAEGPTGLAPDHLRSILAVSADGCGSLEKVERFLEKITT